MNRWIKFFACVSAAVLVGLFVNGCSSSSKTQFVDSIDGQWENSSGGPKLAIHFHGDKKSIELGDMTLPVTVKPVNDDTITMDAAAPAQSPKDWKIIRVWNGNGSGFGIALIHDGKRDDFTAAGKS
ncbi:MAG: hypothetical protein V1793_13810 [Pseudomonadota bacterium]